ncbi:hypothetical protein [Rhizobium tumorigenes]|uniref:Uncharacterized protein n=1 Tax=Rhizobium tumorigenes TaxID=2041385 RepID=A0AAF1KTG6_9HYPH|nr:hypothetical protein [Rhizobium tumorigenes]WFR97180.1 hypothetical protein PR017_08800 [Rhizobium tumorigenes]
MMIEASTLFHASVHYRGIVLHNGVLTLPRLQAIVVKTAPKKAKITDADIIRAVTSRDGTFELDGWRIKVSAIQQVDRP